uniref:Lipocalin/cytosolic fatty-acid binding domain-containing protein n=1 Tax=Loxodonta africana TaxID=9785 RepID=G3TW30_LOXAF
MKVLLLCLGLSLVCAHNEGDDNVVKSDFDFKKVKHHYESWPQALSSRRGSSCGFPSLFLTFHSCINGKCTEIDFVCDETEEKGVYSVIYDGNNTFKIIEAVYDEYVIFHLTNFNNGATFQLMELYGRKEDINQEVKEKFVEYCKQYGIPEENILDLTKVDRCLQARS